MNPRAYHLWYLGGSSLRAGGNGTAGTTMAVPVFEGEKFTLVPSTQCWDSLQVLQYPTVFAYCKRSKTGAGEGLASFPGPARVRRLQYEILCANFVLQATNAQGLGTRLGKVPISSKRSYRYLTSKLHSSALNLSVGH